MALAPIMTKMYQNPVTVITHKQGKIPSFHHELVKIVNKLHVLNKRLLVFLYQRRAFLIS